MIFLCGLCALCGLAILMFPSFSSSEISPDSTEKLNLSGTQSTWAAQNSFSSCGDGCGNAGDTRPAVSPSTIVQPSSFINFSRA